MKRNHLKEYFVNLYSGNLFSSSKKLIREQDEEEKEDEGGGLFDDAEEEDKPEDEGDEEKPEDDNEEESDKGEEEEKEKPELTPQEYIEYGSSISQELTSVFDEFAAGAMKSDFARQEDLKDPEDEILPESITKAIYEQKVQADEFDMSYFSAEIARLINNYENLLDMESLIYIQAKDYLLKRFDDEDLVNEFDSYIKDRHKINLKTPEDKGETFAVGATGGSAGG